MTENLTVLPNLTPTRQITYHVRLKPAPPVVIRTTTGCHNRLEVVGRIDEGTTEVFRRISRQFLKQIEQELSQAVPDSERHSRLTEILSLARQTPGVDQDDLENPPFPDLSYY